MTTGLNTPGMIFRVDFKSGRPAYLQLVEQIKGAAASGLLRPGEPLPAIGQVAGELRIGHNSVAKAYAELESLGIIELVPEKGHCLKEHHRPLRKAVARTVPEGNVRSPRIPRRTLRHRIISYLAVLPVTAAYLVFIGLLAVLLVRFGILRGEATAIVATLLLATAFLPLRHRIHQALERRFLSKHHHLPQALQSLKLQSWSATNLDALMDQVLQTSESVIGVRPALIRDRSEVLALVSSFPALRSAREPIPAGNDFLMPLFSHDEVLGVLRLSTRSAERDYDPEDWEFLVGVGEQVAQVAEHLRRRSEKAESEYALDIQRGLLPHTVPQVPGFSIAGAWQPAKAIGGDYYDVFRLSDSEVALILADVSGKGVPAALLMASLQATTKAYARLSSSPQELCERVNRAICESISAGRFVTFFYAVLDAEHRTLTYTNAGHNSPLLVSPDGGCRHLDVGGPVLGVFADAAYEQARIDLVAGDRLVIFTDGIVEAADAAGKEFGDERLFTVVTASARTSAGGLRDSVMQAVTRFCAGEFADDATLLVVVADS